MSFRVPWQLGRSTVWQVFVFYLKSDPPAQPPWVLGTKSMHHVVQHATLHFYLKMRLTIILSSFSRLFPLLEAQVRSQQPVLSPGSQRSPHTKSPEASKLSFGLCWFPSFVFAAQPSLLKSCFLLTEQCGCLLIHYNFLLLQTGPDDVTLGPLCTVLYGSE